MYIYIYVCVFKLKSGPVDFINFSYVFNRRSTCQCYVFFNLCLRISLKMCLFLSRLTTDMRFAPFSCPERGSWIQGSQERDFSMMLQESLQPAVCLHKYPRSQIEVNLMVLENGGSVLAHAITCASLALADAGIEMYDLVLGCSIRQDGASYVVDPSYAEENSPGSLGSNQGSLTVAFLPSLNQISGLQSDGEMAEDTLTAGVRTCIEGCYKLYPVVQRVLSRSVSRAASAPS